MCHTRCKEDDVLKCPNATGNDVKCSPQESVVIRCRGDGECEVDTSPKRAYINFLKCSDPSPPVHGKQGVGNMKKVAYYTMR